MECVASLHEVKAALECVCLDWASLGSGEEEDDVLREDKIGN